MGPQTVLEIIAIKVVELTYVGLLAYGLRLAGAYLNHRLDVLGKDAFVFYRRDRYRDEPKWTFPETTRCTDEPNTDEPNTDDLDGGTGGLGFGPRHGGGRS